MPITETLRYYDCEASLSAGSYQTRYLVPQMGPTKSPI